jgi:hypothetical protein
MFIGIGIGIPLGNGVNPWRIARPLALENDDLLVTEDDNQLTTET